MKYDFLTVFRLVTATLLPVLLAVILYLAEGKTRFGKMNHRAKQWIIGVLFGGVAVLATEFGIPIEGAVLNVRNAAPLTAGAGLRRSCRNSCRRHRRCAPVVFHLLGRRGIQVSSPAPLRRS